MIPNVVTTKLKTKYGHLIVARDDLLPGGTKQRAAVPFIQKMMELGHKEFNYASPFCGYAQIALAIACQLCKARCHIFAVKDKGSISRYSSIAASYGARLFLFNTLEEAEIASDEANGFKIPLGFNHKLYESCFETALKHQLNTISGFENVWVPVGSGTLARAMRACLPSHTMLLCINIGVLSNNDERIISLTKLQNTIVIHSPEEFASPANILPSIPSNPYYDAKLWRFLVNQAKENDLWWNVAC